MTHLHVYHSFSRHFSAICLPFFAARPDGWRPVVHVLSGSRVGALLEVSNGGNAEENPARWMCLKIWEWVKTSYYHIWENKPAIVGYLGYQGFDPSPYRKILPSGDLTVCYGKSPFSIGKSSCLSSRNGPFSTGLR